MSQEAAPIIRSMLFNAMMAEAENRNMSYMVRSISAMCTKDDIAAVKEQVAEALKDRTEEK